MLLKSTDKNLRWNSLISNIEQSLIFLLLLFSFLLNFVLLLNSKKNTCWLSWSVAVDREGSNKKKTFSLVEQLIEK